VGITIADADIIEGAPTLIEGSLGFETWEGANERLNFYFRGLTNGRWFLELLRSDICVHDWGIGTIDGFDKDAASGGYTKENSRRIIDQELKKLGF
jgi:hypothetical protein